MDSTELKVLETPLSTAINGRNNNFGIIRLVLALLVIVSHVQELIDGNRSNELLTRLFHTRSFGDVAVDGFFVLSGCMILQSWQRVPKLWPYLCKRCLRIYPAFITATLVAAFLIGPATALPWQPVNARARHNVKTAEPVLARYRRMPALHDPWTEHGDITETTADAMQVSLALSPSGRAHRDVGLYYLKQCNYSLALQHLKRSDCRKPEVRKAIQIARHALRMEQLASHSLDPGYTIYRSFSFRVSGRMLWVALSGKSIEKEEDAHPNRARILVLEDRADRARLVWQSPVLPDIQDRGFTELDLWPLRMTGSSNAQLSLWV